MPLAELSTEPSMVIHRASNRKISYGEVASFATLPEKMPQIPAAQLKDPKNFA
ncbi:MAG: hypothetical protein IPO07_25000 [Haliscomenobacter sp.]|nr:hypothetical protein [Haliscomenobacter sp.]MBK9491693.1 hypothetical protein [Haliscomenobacter sp.]